MGKLKKRKTQHLTDAEIWDDSALIRSWDEAVQEYEYYHSIHARGEDVAEVLRQAELDANAGFTLSGLAGENVKHAAESAPGSVDEEYEDGEVEDEDLGRPTSPTHEGAAHTYNGANGAAIGAITNGEASVTEGPLSPTQMLENIKMAYWWAGYYSGLYEAQHPSKEVTASESMQDKSKEAGNG